MRGRIPGRLPAPFGRFDVAVLASRAATLALWIAQPIGRLTAAALAVTAVLNFVRLARWAGDRTLRDRLVLILHLGYAFVPLGFLLSSAAALDIVVPSAGVHAWTVGAAGTMTLAVMTRASLGHTGNALTASPMTQAIYAAVVIAALARICASLEPASSEALLHVAAFAWCIAFLALPVVWANARRRLSGGSIDALAERITFITRAAFGLLLINRA